MTGPSTGTCATAASFAAASALKNGCLNEARIQLPNETYWSLKILDTTILSPGKKAKARLIKPHSGDADVTAGSCIEATVEVFPQDGEVHFFAGKGVGVVTGPGLQIPLGEPAINPVPRHMITAHLRKLFPSQEIHVTISVEQGEELAKKTYNPKLGIVGGISILGTSGLVIPYSEEAAKRSLLVELDVAKARGFQHLYLCPGGFGQTAAAALYNPAAEAIVHVGNYMGDVLIACAERQIQKVTMVGHPGKLAKIAAGIFNTHSRNGDARAETIAALAAANGASPSLVRTILKAKTTEEMIDLLKAHRLESTWNLLAARAAEKSMELVPLTIACTLTSYDGTILGSFPQLSPTQTQAEVSQQPIPIVVVGVGPGEARFLTEQARRMAHEADLLVGGQRQLALFDTEKAKKHLLTSHLEEAFQEIRVAYRDGKRVVVAASGDPCCFGILDTLRNGLPEATFEVCPGISSIQLAMARLSLRWNETTISSCHGRPLEHVLNLIQMNPHTLVLVDSKQSASKLASALERYNANIELHVLERLGYDDERITKGSPNQIAALEFDPLAVVYAKRLGPTQPRERNCIPPGISDDCFLRDKAPMTKAEIRSLSLAKLRLSQTSRVLDIGAGTGSVSIEAALLCPFGEVVAVEKESSSIELITKNASLFRLNNLKIIEGMAPAALNHLGKFDAIFIGGSSGKMQSIVECAWSHLADNGILVANVICIGSLQNLVESLQNTQWSNFELLQVNLSKAEPIGRDLRFVPQNPVWIASANKNSSSINMTSKDENSEP